MPKILLVDDDLSPTDLFALAFRRKGFDITVAFNREEALALAAREPPDAILLDLKIRDLSTNNIIIALRAALRSDNIPILVMSSAPYAIASAAIPGATAYLHKPVNVLEMATRLSRVVKEGAAPV